MTNSTLLMLMLSDLDLKSENSLISLKKTGPVAQMYMDKVGGIYATLFTSDEKMNHINTNKFKYSQIVNLATLVNFVLSEDLDGIILNPESDNVLITRYNLLKYSLGFERFANDERLSESMYYMFKLKL